MRRRSIPTLVALPIALLASRDAAAKPVAPDLFCANYGEVAACAGGVAACSLCHTSTNPPAWNAYGADVRNALSGTDLEVEEFVAELPSALSAVEALDSDGDGYANLAEIDNGSLPGNGDSVPFTAECPEDTSGLEYPVCRYSPRHVLRKVHLDFCGRSPSWDAMQAFDALAPDAQTEALHQALDACLDSEFWLGKDGVLWQMAHSKIRPVGSLKAGEDEGQLPVADYFHDYQLYVWSQIDHHDARAVLTADFFVERSGPPTTYTVVADTNNEPMQPERRVGNMTTQWFLIYYVMFTPLPRSAAAQAYRAYLGFDIAKDEGLSWPISDEPVDYDDKGVDAEACAVCHSTLDPLTYAFRNYNGLALAPGMPRAKYVDDRLETAFGYGSDIAQTPESGYLMGAAYQDLAEWAQVGANSDAFAVAAVRDYWRLLIGRDPLASEQPELDELWQRLKTDHVYSIERMLHDLILTEAYGAP